MTRATDCEEDAVFTGNLLHMAHENSTGFVDDLSIGNRGDEPSGWRPATVGDIRNHHCSGSRRPPHNPFNCQYEWPCTSWRTILDLFPVSDVKENDGEVARYTVAPETALPTAVADSNTPGAARRAELRIDQTAGQPA